MTNNSARGTGRTTRMLLSAIDYVQRTKQPVHIYMANPSAYKSTREYLNTVLAPHIRSEFFVLHSLRDEMQFNNFNLLTMQMRGGETTEPVFIDHYALELMLELPLKELHRYDNPITSK